MKNFVLVILFIIFPLYSVAWDATGHRIIAWIAFDNLSDQAKFEINYFLGSAHSKNNNYKFLNAAVWPDYIKGKNVTAFNSWHYINIPFSTDHATLPNVNVDNVQWAINQSVQVLRNGKENKASKKLFLKFLIHFVGDAHQPLHCATLISKTFPRGDLGGVLFPIQADNSNNLHDYWDAGLGYFKSNSLNKPLKYWQVRQMANMIEKRYPKQYFGAKIRDLNPGDWVQSSFNLARLYSYNIGLNGEPSKNYIEQGWQIVQQQIALAGYRLANELNEIFKS